MEGCLGVEVDISTNINNDNWVKNDSTLHNNLFYQDYMRLIELGKKKSEKLVTSILFKLMHLMKLKKTSLHH